MCSCRVLCVLNNWDDRYPYGLPLSFKLNVPDIRNQVFASSSLLRNCLCHWPYASLYEFLWISLCNFFSAIAVIKFNVAQSGPTQMIRPSEFTSTPNSHCPLASGEWRILAGWVSATCFWSVGWRISQTHFLVEHSLFLLFPLVAFSFCIALVLVNLYRPPTPSLVPFFI